VLSEWAQWSPCSATCGGGQHTRSREILQHPTKGGKGCLSSLSEVHECGRSSCSGGDNGPTPQDCKHGDWQDWEACSKCSGERKRFRSIIQYARNGGKNCEPFDSEEAASCPRQCHKRLMCIWASWAGWSDCTATCGAGARRHRRRYLHLGYDESTELPSQAENIIAEYDALSQRGKALEMNHLRENLVAFACGCMSLVVAFAGFRGLSAARSRRSRLSRWDGTDGQGLELYHPDVAYRSQRQATAYCHLREINESELPLVSEILRGDVTE